MSNAPQNWRLNKERFGLVGLECPHCEVRLFPPRDVCKECGLTTIQLIADGDGVPVDLAIDVGLLVVESE